MRLNPVTTYNQYREIPPAYAYFELSELTCCKSNIPSDSLLESIKTHGIANPLLFVENSLILLDGFSRLGAARLLCLKEVPVNFLQVSFLENLKKKVCPISFGGLNRLEGYRRCLHQRRDGL